MSAKTGTTEPVGGGSFLGVDATPDEVFTREDLSGAQQMFGRVAEDFMRSEVVPRDAEIHAKDWALTRELLLKAGELDLLRVDIPEAYGGLGLDKVSGVEDHREFRCRMLHQQGLDERGAGLRGR